MKLYKIEVPPLTLTSVIIQLKTAKDNVRWLLSNDGTVDMHDIKYWSSEVVRLRELLKNSL